ncbi:MAG: hypothetical protein LBM96_01340 [Methanobrevibacter sp.]|jgi:hypothetical protein|nr:hypothetical protein [Candidatus Methanoflexus mossambicus]
MIGSDKDMFSKLKRLFGNKKFLIAFIIILIVLISITLVATVFSKDNIRNAVWINGKLMNNVDLDELSYNGVENIFLNSNAVDLYGEKKVSNWINNANNKGIKVHIWVKCFYNGKWINPIDNNTKDHNYDYFNKKIAEINKYANIEGVSGIHLDYVRYPGNAYKYQSASKPTPSQAITKFVEMVSNNLNSNNKHLTLSIAVMPEKEDKYYYGQDISALSAYVDVIVPMIYMGNYEKGANWLNETTHYFKEKSGFANVCIGIQSYESDNNVTPLPKKELRTICQGALDSGADGVALFTYGLINWFNLNSLI